MIDVQEIQILAQLIEAINEAALKLESAKNKNNKEKYEQAEGEILGFQEQIAQILRQK